MPKGILGPNLLVWSVTEAGLGVVRVPFCIIASVGSAASSFCLCWAFHLGPNLFYPMPMAGPGVARVPFRVIASVGICRLVILPLLGVGMVMGAYAASIFTAPDPIFLLVLLIQVCDDIVR